MCVSLAYHLCITCLQLDKDNNKKTKKGQQNKKIKRSGHNKRVAFVNNIMLLEAAARNDVQEGKWSKRV